MDHAAAWQCGSVQQCAAVCDSASGSLCGSAHSSVLAVHVKVCGSALGSVWQCVQQCAAVRQCGSVWQCGSVRQQCKRQCVAVSTAVCGSSASGIVPQCAW
jgi:hypothetical protein